LGYQKPVSHVDPNKMRQTFRSLVHKPGFTLAATLTLALAIGMAASVFSVVNAVLLRPLRLPEPERLALIWGAQRNGEQRGPVSFGDFEDWRVNSHAFEAAAAFTPFYKPVLTGASQPERLSALLVSHEYFRVLQARPALGRFFLPEEDWAGRNDVAVLSHALWRDRFGSDRSLIGRSIQLDGRPITVVGVAAADLQTLPASLGGEPALIYRPVGEGRGKGLRDGRHLRTLVRLKPGVTIEQAQAELDLLCRDMEREHPDADAALAVRLVRLPEDLTRNLRQGLIALQGAVLALLLIACANVANLSLARSSARRREMAIRAALGAGIVRLARMLLTESVLLGAAGGAGGLLLAWWSTEALRLIARRILPDAGEIPLDLHVLAFSAALSIGAGLLFGMAPVLQLVRSRLDEALRNSGRISGDGRQGLRQSLAAGQIALALVLLISASLLARSFAQLRGKDPGFDPRGVLTAGIALPLSHYPNEAGRVAFFERLLARLRALPGVEHAAIGTPLPISGNFDRTNIEIPGRHFDAGERQSPDRYLVSPDYFATARIPLRHGRLFDSRDDAQHQPVAIVSETAARLWWPGEPAIGRKVRAGGTGDFDKSPFREVVGVVSDVAQYGLGLPSTPQIYMPHAQFAVQFMTLLVRAKGDADALAKPLRQAVLAEDSEQPIYDVAPFEAIVADSVAARRFAIWMLGVFALGALILAAVGIYGVVSYGVAQRTQEFGIRMALGAQPGDVLRHAMYQGVVMIMVGLGAGLSGALAATRLLASFLYGVSATDLLTLGVSIVALTLVAAVACYLPARRAARVDPLVALKYE
jgi:putative ABC transport system permease protein